MKKSLLLILLSIFIPLVSGLALFNDATNISLNRLKVERITLSDALIPKSLDGTKIVYFSDLHLFANDNNGFIAEVFDAIAYEDADIILFGGDFIDASKAGITDDQLSFIDDQLNKLNPDLGFFAVLGQDDTFHLDQLNVIYQNHTIEILENTAVLIRNKSNIGIQLFGYHGLETSLENLNPNLYTLGFMYDPEWITDFESNQFDQVIAAKTHGGQVNLPFVKASYSRADSDFVSGTMIINQNPLLISNGISTLEYQARLFRDPSIYVFTLKQS